MSIKRTCHVGQFGNILQLAAVGLSAHCRQLWVYIYLKELSLGKERIQLLDVSIG